MSTFTHASPLSRHKTSSTLHYACYLIHDISANLFLGLFILSFYYHTGFAMLVSLAIAILTGWMLIRYRLKIKNPDAQVTTTEIITTCMINQGFAVMLLGWLFFGLPTQPHLFVIASLFIALHAGFSFIKCCRLLWRNPTSETTIQLLYMLALPNIFIFSYFCMTPLAQLSHTLLRTGLIFECMPGLLFSISHDKYWIFGPKGLSRLSRELVCLTPYVWVVFSIIALK